MKNLTKESIGLKVVRSKGDYVVGRTGTIVAIQDDLKRVRVDWDGLRTWVSVDVIEPADNPYEIDRTGRFPKYIPNN